MKTVLFQAIQFSISAQFSAIWPIGRILSGATTTCQSGPGSKSNEGVLCIPKSSCITRASSSDCLVSYPGHSLVGGLHHHHHVVLVARISLTLSRHFSLSFIASGRSSGLHPVSSHSCWMYVRAGRPAFARSCVGVHKSTSLRQEWYDKKWLNFNEIVENYCILIDLYRMKKIALPKLLVIKVLIKIKKNIFNFI